MASPVVVQSGWVDRRDVAAVPTLPSNPTPGNLIVCFSMDYVTGGDPAANGWTKGPTNIGMDDRITVFYRYAVAGDTGAGYGAVNGGTGYRTLITFEIAGAATTWAAALAASQITFAPAATTYTPPAINATADDQLALSVSSRYLVFGSGTPTFAAPWVARAGGSAFAQQSRGASLPLAKTGDLVQPTITVGSAAASGRSINAGTIILQAAPSTQPATGQGPLGTLALSAPVGGLVVAAAGPLGTLALSAPTGGVPTPTEATGALGTLTLSAPGATEARLTQMGSLVPAVGDPVPRVTQFMGAVASFTKANARITSMGLLVLAKGGETPLQPSPLQLQDGGRDQLLYQRLVNMYVESTPQGPTPNARFGRPGLYQVAALGAGPIRATFLHRGFRYTVSGTSVWRDALNIGEVPAEGELRWAISDEEIVVVSGRRAYYVTLDEVVRITDPDLPYVRDVKFLAGRFVYFDDDSSGFYRYSKVNDARSIDGLAFASAEASPDAIIGAEVQGEALAIFGSLTTEWHYGTTDPNNPFRRSQGRTYDKGCLCIQTVQLADNSLFFVGHDRMVYRAAQGPTRASDHSVEDKLRRQTEEQFRANSAFVVVFGGHTFYVLNIVGQGTWALDIGQELWAEWKSWGSDRFRVAVADRDGFMGDAFSGRILGFDGKRFNDLDFPLERVVSTFQPLKNGTLKNFNLALHCQQGVGALPGSGEEEPVVEMRFSDHMGLDYTNWMEAPLGRHQVRGRESLSMWTSLGSFAPPGRVFEFRCTDDVEFTPYSVSFNEARP